MKNIGTIVIYKLKGLEQIKRDKFCRAFLGRTVETHRGKYTHHIEGILDHIPHIRITKGVIIIEKINKRRISEFLKKHRVREVFIRDVILIKQDIRQMTKNENTR